MNTGDALNQQWENNPYEIRMFLEMQPHYEKLAEEVAYILKKGVQAANIEYATISYRVKKLESFCEKAIRKNYKKPLEEINDVAGVRLVFLYLTDLPKLEALIEKEFQIVEKIDKLGESDPNQFGYSALHYIVNIGEKASGARYDDLKELICEIQVRTILQDAWAIVAHHLSYKQESDVPKELQRKLNALSGLFETADNQFDHLRDERLGYKEKIIQQISRHESEFLKSKINLDNLIEFLNWRLPDREPEEKKYVSELLSELTCLGYTKLVELDKLLSQTYEAVKAYEAKYPPTKSTEEGGFENISFVQVGVIRIALELIDDKFMNYKKLDKTLRQNIEEFRYLVKKDK